jgi:hypothetical protein
MSGNFTYHCDVCRKAKGEANHCWMALATIKDEDLTEFYPTLLVWPWDDGHAERHEHVKHLCGADCLFKYQSQWMAEVSAITAKHQPKPAGELSPAEETTQ